MAIKKLQNNFTTPQQSKRLLELGVPADSADCFYINDEYTPHVRDELYERNTGYKFPFSEEGFAPCWSVGRLIEILLLCHKFDEAGIMFDKHLYEVSNYTNIEWCIRVLESSLQCRNMDFSRLED